MVWLVLAAIASLTVNNVPAFFHAPLRLVTFILVLALIGPIITSESLDVLKKLTFYRLNYFIVIGSALSFLVYLGLPVQQYKGFSGFFNHPMVLGPLAGISLILIFYKLLSNYGNSTRNQKRSYIVAIVICFLVLLLASSRAAIAGTITGITLFLYKYYKERFSKFLSAILFVVLFVNVTFPVWSDYTGGVQEKQKISNKSEDLASSRRALWVVRIAEFKESPVFGIGFATLDISKKGSSVQKGSGTIEPGSSWLAVLSMIGIVGFIPVFLIFYRNLSFLLQDQINPSTSAALVGLLIFFVTHMFAEGYIFASGNFLFFYVWLLLGVIETYRKDPSVKII